MPVHVSKVSYQIRDGSYTSFHRFLVFDNHPIGLKEAESMVSEKITVPLEYEETLADIEVEEIPLNQIHMKDLDLEEYIQLHKLLNY